ncbi:MAG: hypothetical protein VYD03_10900, partial [Pseudomonadota bacterium]|nr:hypothetical protein [Pseudomonadota bacterium]
PLTEPQGWDVSLKGFTIGSCYRCALLHFSTPLDLGLNPLLQCGGSARVTASREGSKTKWK